MTASPFLLCPTKMCLLNDVCDYTGCLLSPGAGTWALSGWCCLANKTHSERKRAQPTARENDVYWKVQGDVEMAWDERQREKGSDAGL